MSYQVLARKWRPQRFADVLGQEHITTTLQNAIQRERVGHAYLFVGPRGIGKTTSARIFAKALNCATPETDANGRIEPCCTCTSCTEIAAGNCLDVIELDGASHNKVEDIRDLCESVQYTPTNGRKYKIYIIDEVHMLTTQAWNALLKTLEEPPAHVKFLFATTESHKVLATILSRTQRFDLKRIPPTTIVQRLREIAEKEGVFIDNAALSVIARAAEGGMRDSQSIFDQMIAFCGGMKEENTITEKDVIDVFGMTSQGELQSIQHAMLTNTPADLLASVHNLADKGRDLEKLYGDILQGLRNVMLTQVAKDPRKILEVAESEIAAIEELAGLTRPNTVQRLVEGMLQSGDQIRHTLNKRVFIEVTLLKIMQDAHAVQVDDLITALRNWKEDGDLPDLSQTGDEKKKSSPVETAPAETLQETSSSSAQPKPPEPPARQAPVKQQSPPASQAQPTQVATEPQLAPFVAQAQSPAPDTQPLAGEGTSAPIRTQNSEPRTQNSEPKAGEGTSPVYASGSSDVPTPAQQPPAPNPSSPSPTARGFAEASNQPLADDVPVSTVGTGPRFNRGPEIMERVQNNDFVQKVVEEFDGKIVDACTRIDPPSPDSTPTNQ